MPITDVTVIALEGEQALVFQNLDRLEADAVQQAAKPFRAQRDAMVTAILAGKGLLAAYEQSPGCQVAVDPVSGITITPSNPAATPE